MSGPLTLLNLYRRAGRKVPKLRRDNPGGEWLQGQIDKVIREGEHPWGTPKTMGSTTGYFGDEVVLPVDLLKGFTGMRNEQKRVRQDDLDWLMNYMGEKGHLPLSEFTGKEYAPFVQVDYRGRPWVNEGNHRIMAADRLGWDYLPIELRYHAGGEDAVGPLSPWKILPEEIDE